MVSRKEYEKMLNASEVLVTAGTLSASLSASLAKKALRESSAHKRADYIGKVLKSISKKKI